MKIYDALYNLEDDPGEAVNVYDIKRTYLQASIADYPRFSK